MNFRRSIFIFSLLVVFLFGCENPTMNNFSEEKIVQDRSVLNSASLTKEGFTANVMAPLYVKNENWAAFEAQLATAKSIGVDAVSVDVWWGDVEASGDQQFNWTYYDKLFNSIVGAGLDIVAIMSFHQCGGNVGDDYTSLVPSWVWNNYTSQGISPDDMKYKGEANTYCQEYVSLWADDYVVEEYIEFMEAFEAQYADIAEDFDEINVSCGTAGELRYPSYNAHDWGGYPNRGTFQFYGRLAIEDFRNSMKDKYNDISSVNAAWGTSLSSFEDVNVPSDPGLFVSSHAYENMQYGKDLIFWYNNSLKLHGKRMIGAATQALDGDFSSVDIGVKMAGVHWTMGDSSTPRIAEITAGLIETTGDYFSETTGHGYKNLLSVCVDNSRDTVFHFTCLEMSNGNYAPAYSLAQDLVFWVADEAESQGIVIKGENALSGGVESDNGWNNIDNAFEWASYSGLTVLRIGNVTENYTGKNRYQQFIDKYSDDEGDLIIHYQEFETASSYGIHCWDGLDGNYGITYEGLFNGEHWWKITVNDAPASFKFCFYNSNRNWDGVNRTYDGQADEIYISDFDGAVYTSRP